MILYILQWYKGEAYTGGTSKVSCHNVFSAINRGAYDEEVLVYAVQSDGSTDSQPLTASVLVETEPDNFTCPLEDTSTTGTSALSPLTLPVLYLESSPCVCGDAVP